VIEYLVKNYVTFREVYNIDNFTRQVSGVKAHSSPAVYAAFERHMDPRNSTSPIALYQRHSTRRIHILRTRYISMHDASDIDGEYVVEVLFEATVNSREGEEKARFVAQITFNYSGIEREENESQQWRGNNGVAMAWFAPIEFVVTRYQTKRS